ncbi:UNVERIFIED_CONTAM: zinc finger protein, putative [Hammondia hammondi]|eukprot:XP_008885518.1 zinc finger protein, putative [Hammondia hammondi]
MLNNPPSPPPAASEKISKRTGPELNARLSKTRLCRFVTSRRICPFGPSCTYAHSDAELVPSPNLTKTKVCWSNMYGRCVRGSECPYAHNEEELRRLPRLAIPLKSGAPLPPSSPYVVYYATNDPRGPSTVLQETKAVRLSDTASNGQENPSEKAEMEGIAEYISWSSDDDTVSSTESTYSSLQTQSSTENRQETVDMESAVKIPGNCSDRTVCIEPPCISGDYNTQEEASVASADEQARLGKTYTPRRRDMLPFCRGQTVNPSDGSPTAAIPSRGGESSANGVCVLPQQNPLSDVFLDSQSSMIKHSDIEWLLEEDRVSLGRTEYSLSDPAVHNIPGMQRGPFYVYNPLFAPKRDCETYSSAVGRPPYLVDDKRGREHEGKNTMGVVDLQAARKANNPVVRWDGPVPDLRGDWLDRIKLRDCVSIS